jgi:hypothetical protein
LSNFTDKSGNPSKEHPSESPAKGSAFHPSVFTPMPDFKNRKSKKTKVVGVRRKSGSVIWSKPEVI